MPAAGEADIAGSVSLQLRQQRTIAHDEQMNGGGNRFRQLAHGRHERGQIFFRSHPSYIEQQQRSFNPVTLPHLS
ncbi:hypothetical protein D3C80_1738550 [compost metagenome]